MISGKIVQSTKTDIIINTKGITPLMMSAMVRPSSGGAEPLSTKIDMAIGGDQGGSIRMPASFCGCYGMKPTHGLVPYTGVMPIETTIDHTGAGYVQVRSFYKELCLLCRDITSFWLELEARVARTEQHLGVFTLEITHTYQNNKPRIQLIHIYGIGIIL